MAGKPRKKVTISTIAAAVGCSRSTVSFVLLGKAKQMRISDQMIEKVQTKAKEMNYVPNEMARMFRRQRSGAIGVVFPHLMDEWPARLIEAIRSVLVERNFIPLVTTSRQDSALEHLEFQWLIERQVEAIICMPQVDSDNYQSILDRGLPLVFIGAAPEEKYPEASYVVWDSESAAQAAVEYLISLGKKRIACISADRDDPFLRNRFIGYSAALKNADLEFREEWMGSFSLYDVPAEKIEKILNSRAERPDAFFVSTHLQSIQVLTILEEMGIRIPEEIAVMSMGDHPITRHPKIALSTIQAPLEEIGEEAARAVLRLIADADCAPIRKKLTRNTVIARATTGISL